MAPLQARGHELLEHTADVGLRIWAPDLDDLFSEAAVGLIDVMGATEEAADRSRRVELQAPDVDALLVDWLSEVLFLFEAKQFVPRSVEAAVVRGPWRVEATLRGAGAEAFRQHGPAVKAITYHGLQIGETDSGYEARVYLDV